LRWSSKHQVSDGDGVLKKLKYADNIMKIMEGEGGVQASGKGISLKPWVKRNGYRYWRGGLTW
jgi:hypothetical protein